MSIGRRLKQLEGNVKELPKGIVTYTILDSEVVDNEIVKFIVEKEFQGKRELMEREEYLKELEYYRNNSKTHFFIR